MEHEQHELIRPAPRSVLNGKMELEGTDATGTLRQFYRVQER